MYKPQPYCTQPREDGENCETCSLVNYGRDCRNKSIAAVALGRLGGLKTSPRKAAAVRANGRKGGRPRPEEGKGTMKKMKTLKITVTIDKGGERQAGVRFRCASEAVARKLEAAYGQTTGEFERIVDGLVAAGKAEYVG